MREIHKVLLRLWISPLGYLNIKSTILQITILPNYAIVPLMKELIKITFIEGLQNIVQQELEEKISPSIFAIHADCIYIHPIDNPKKLLEMKSILQVYFVIQDPILHPAYISKHKSFLNPIMNQVFDLHIKKPTSFRLSCAGDNSDEVLQIKKYIAEQFKISENISDPELKIVIAKIKDTSFWELSVSLNKKALSHRNYRKENFPGAINSTIAYAMNILGNIHHAKRYLNIFSGSGTLLIEAGQENSQLELIGFDNTSKTISISIRNITSAGLIQKIQIKQADVFENPELGLFDVITSDLPFGMVIGKKIDLEKLYDMTTHYTYEHLEPNGTAVLYSSESVLLKQTIKKNKLVIDQEIPLKIISSEGTYLYPTIFVCKKSP